jgi:plastocyanin
VAACGDDGGPASPSNGTGTIAATVVIDSTGNVAPRDVTVAPGSRVTFTNNHNRPHNMNSDPHPEHTLCPDLNVGVLQPGQSRTSGNLNTPRACGYHDHDDPGNRALQGTVRVQ